MERWPAAPPHLSDHPLVNTSDIEEARTLYSHLNTPVSLERADRKAPFAWRSNLIVVGLVTITSSGHSSGIVAKTGSVEEIYSFSIPVGATGGEAVLGTTTVSLVRGSTGFLASPKQPVKVQLAEGFQGLQASVRRQFVEDAFLALHGTPARGPLQFAPLVAMRSEPGAAVIRLIHFLVREVELRGPVLSSPLLLARYSDLLIHTLLTGHPHNQQARIHAPRDAGPAHLRRVEDFIAANVDKPLTLSELAAVAGVSGRALQATFRRHRGSSPMEFLRERRLSLARERLRSAQADVTVAQIALDCGFEHLGRFSARYRRAFGEDPSATLRRKGAAAPRGGDRK